MTAKEYALKIVMVKTEYEIDQLLIDAHSDTDVTIEDIYWLTRLVLLRKEPIKP